MLAEAGLRRALKYNDKYYEGYNSVMQHESRVSYIERADFLIMRKDWLLPQYKESKIIRRYRDANRNSKTTCL